MQDGWEVLTEWKRLNERAKRMMAAMAAAAPADATLSGAYSGKRRNLMLYGPGSEERLPIVQRVVKHGGHVAMWDLGYWDRADSMRLAIDTLHPTPAQLMAADGLPARRDFALREDADPSGPILLIGLGPKSVFAYGISGPGEWERRKLKDLRHRYPGREIVYRAKGKRGAEIPGVPTREGMTIEEALRGCSLVVCRHSNVAVDACVAGVPVECEDGAAAALYRDGPAPSRADRAAFLRRLTWWEWSRHDARDAWAWIARMTA